MNIDGLMRELLKTASQFGADYVSGSPEARLIRVLLDRLITLTVAPLFLPQPRDERLKRITNAIAKDLSDGTPLEGWAKRAGVTTRTAATEASKQSAHSKAEPRASSKNLAL